MKAIVYILFILFKLCPRYGSDMLTETMPSY